MKLNKLYFNWNSCLSYNKTWNFAISSRGSGKSVNGWIHLWNAYHYENRPSLVLRRRIADITPAYIDDIENLLNKFLKQKIQLIYLKGDIKSGVVDVKLGDFGVDYSWQAIKKLPIFFRVIGLSNPMSRIKSLMVSDIKYIFFDEFIVNLKVHEKYLEDEAFMINEIYSTFNRESSTPIRILCAGNPYSVYCPLFVYLGVDTSKLKPGALVVGKNYVINCFDPPMELKKQLWEANPIYHEDNDLYVKYAFNGESILDQNIKIQKSEPQGFKLKFVFKIGDEFLSIHQGAYSCTQKERFWACTHKSDWLEKIGKNRKIVVFDFRDMCEGSTLMNSNLLLSFTPLRQAIQNRDITFNCINASYLVEDLYGTL